MYTIDCWIACYRMIVRKIKCSEQIEKPVVKTGFSVSKRVPVAWGL